MVTGKPFTQLRSGVKGSIERELEKCLPNMVEDVQKVFHQILNDFDRMFVVVEVDDPRTNELRRQVQAFVSQARSCIDGPIFRELAIAMGCSPTGNDIFA